MNVIRTILTPSILTASVFPLEPALSVGYSPGSSVERMITSTNPSLSTDHKPDYIKVIPLRVFRGVVCAFGAIQVSEYRVFSSHLDHYLLCIIVVARNNSSAPISRLLQTESIDARFKLLNAWLRRCDLSHDCKKHGTVLDHQMPSRFLDIGESDSGVLRLVRASELGGRRYVALSHRWGSLSLDEKRIYCTTKYNISERSEGFNTSQLPSTFQDAVRVTREIGVRYLWIDSLCIIQYGDNGEDWQREYCRMESVFSEAYCTISAVAATDSKSGFLSRTTDTEYADILVEDSAGKKFHVSDDIDDYDRDVGESEISKRAWVMQEAILSRRIIHFTTNQMYWECGEGVQCENLTALTA